MQYVPPSPDLAAVDPRFLILGHERQMRVINVLLVVASCPMRLAVDAVLMTDAQLTELLPPEG